MSVDLVCKVNNYMCFSPSASSLSFLSSWGQQHGQNRLREGQAVRAHWARVTANHRRRATTQGLAAHLGGIPSHFPHLSIVFWKENIGLD